MIAEILKTAKKACLFLSGGRDSVVVLSMLREFGPIDCICFRQDFTPKQWAIVENLIKIWDLEVYTFPQKQSYLIPNGPSQLARVDEYGLGNLTFPVVRDIVESPNNNRCVLDMDPKRCELFPFEYDVVFTGSRKSDESFATGKSPFKDQIVKYGEVTFVQPLFDRTDEEIEILARGLPISQEFYAGNDQCFDTGNLIACSRCLNASPSEEVYCFKLGRMINGTAWDQKAMLAEFRTKYSFEG